MQNGIVYYDTIGPLKPLPFFKGSGAHVANDVKPNYNNSAMV